jgi:GNAT superfamily N-acetyltransferase
MIRVRIRAATSDELAGLRDIERAAGSWFRDIGMSAIADDDPPTVDVLEMHRGAGLAWVATDPTDHPVAYLIADRVDGNLHVEQISVHPSSARRGVGRALLDHLARYAVAAGVPALTLTTFAEVPWNAPYYERLGFRALPDGELTPGLRAIRQREAAQGLDRWPRVCMRRDVVDPRILVRAATTTDRERIVGVLVASWGGTVVVGHGVRHDAAELPALLAERDDELVGLLTYDVTEHGLEVVTVDAVVGRAGVGTALFGAAIRVARDLNVGRIWLITTNDNLDALRFCQRRGLRIVHVEPGAVDASRAIKPSIPLVGAYGIELHDELTLELAL